MIYVIVVEKQICLVSYFNKYTEVENGDDILNRLIL